MLPIIRYICARKALKMMAVIGVLYFLEINDTKYGSWRSRADTKYIRADVKTPPFREPKQETDIRTGITQAMLPRT